MMQNSGKFVPLAATNRKRIKIRGIDPKLVSCRSCRRDHEMHVEHFLRQRPDRLDDVRAITDVRSQPAKGCANGGARQVRLIAIMRCFQPSNS
ncbi:hypothetical protein ABIB90_007246 [Bradyrhizobium sp. JR4.1]